MTLLLVTVAAVCVAGILASEARLPRAEWLFKPLASLSFITLALVSGATDSGYGLWLLAGLTCCLAGDVLLIPRNDRTFLAGLVSFLLGHLFYAGAFLHLPLHLPAMLLGAVPVALLAVLSLRWLWRHLPANMQIPVLAYVAVICTMLLMANSTWGDKLGLLVVVGAWGFAISDLSVARNQFIARGIGNRLWGIPLYYASQLLLAFSPTLLTSPG